MINLLSFINEDGRYTAYQWQNKITIETFFYEPLLSVEFDKSTLQCIPITDEEWSGPMFLIFRFVYLQQEIYKHQKAKSRIKREIDGKQFDWI
mgnify:CR=1 FL=1|tara:strand:- start:7493 stop:7771 length:279 start_codon:yes stop_codon:yes gene_type:complete